MKQSRTIKVDNLSDLANQREIHDFFSFSGDIDHIEIQNESEQSRTAFVTFTEEKALEIALLLSGATLVDRIVTISLVENYAIKRDTKLSIVENVPTLPSSAHLIDISRNAEVKSGRVNVSKAQEVVSNILSKGSAIGQDAVNKAKAFDEKHQFRATASAKVTSFDKRVGLTEKLAVGISVVNEKVKSVDQRLHVSDKTMAAIFAAERKLNNTGTAVKSNRYVTAGAAWFDGAFSKVAKVGSVAGTKTRQKFSTTLSNLTSKDPIPA